MKKKPATTTRRPLWDDAAFKRWVEDGARRQGMTVRDALTAAGVSRFYLNDATVEGRSTNIVLNLAEILDASPASLFGLPETPNDTEIMRFWRQMRQEYPTGSSNQFDAMARIIAAQLAALISTANHKSGADPVDIFERVLREYAKLNRRKPPENSEVA
jgi:hypothetical protein